jgi:hypothetical protein
MIEKNIDKSKVGEENKRLEKTVKRRTRRKSCS